MTEDAMVYDRAIIGAGTSAAVYLAYFPIKKDERVIIIGQMEPWAHRGQHRMGQPPHLLELPLPPVPRFDPLGPECGGYQAPIDPYNRPYRIWPETNHFKLPDSKSLPPSDPFMQSNAYAEQVKKDLDAHVGQTREDGRVSLVKRNGDKYEITLENKKDTIRARKVIIASGTGGARESKAWNDAYKNKLNLFVSGESYLNEECKVPDQGTIVVEGGSATAAWAVEKALSHASRVFWFTRWGGTEFTGAFPAGQRNDWLNNRGDKLLRILGELKGSRPSGGQIEVEFKNGFKINCNQYVAAIGAHDGAAYLDKSIKEELTPIKDTQHYLSPKEAAILGLSCDNDNILVVGPAVYQGEYKKGYEQANSYLPRAARPPEGIPTVIATMNALQRYKGGRKLWVNMNLKSFGDLDDYFTNALGYFLEVQFAQYSTRPELGDYTIQEVARFITDQVVGTRIMKTSPYGLSPEEIKDIFGQVWDFAYKNLCVDRLADWRPMLDAYYNIKRNP